MARALQRNQAARCAGKPAASALPRAYARSGNSSLELSTKQGSLRLEPAERFLSDQRIGSLGDHRRIVDHAEARARRNAFAVSLTGKTAAGFLGRCSRAELSTATGHIIRLAHNEDLRGRKGQPLVDGKLHEWYVSADVAKRNHELFLVFIYPPPSLGVLSLYPDIVEVSATELQSAIDLAWRNLVFVH